MTRAAFDPTLADLAHIKVSAVTTLDVAERNNPAKVNVEIESSVLSSILTAARLHYYDNPYRPKLIDANDPMAECARQNEEESRDWHWLMEDSIEVLSGRVAVAVIPARPYDLKDESVASNRKMRPLMLKMDEEDSAKHAAKVDDSREGLQSWVASTGAEALEGGELDKLIRSVRDNPEQAVSSEVVLGLIASLAKANEKVAGHKSMVEAVARVIGR